MSLNFLFFFFIIFLLTDFLIKICLPSMGSYFLDIPNERSAHSFPKLKSGGIFILLVVSIVNIVDIFLNGSTQISQIIIVCSLMSLIGLIDDFLNLSSKFRYLIQLLISLFIIKIAASDLLGYESILYLFTFIILGTAIINLVNFMDGLDGLLSGCVLPLFIFTFFREPSIQLIALTGSTLAFLKWNWEPSKIFLGDCGSNFLGAAIFYLIISNNSEIDHKAIFLIFPLLVDSSFTVIRRFINKENIFIAHKKHLYQRLFQAGINHWKISSFYILMCTINFLILLKDSLLLFSFVMVVESFILLYLDKFIAKQYK